MLYDFSRGALREHVLFPPGSDKHHGLPKDTHKEAGGAIANDTLMN